MIQYKETKKLYQGKYQYRIVLVCQSVHVFRGNNLDNTFIKLSNLNPYEDQSNLLFGARYSKSLQPTEVDYLFNVYDILRSLSDYNLRVENPWLSIYTNNYDDILKLKNLDQNRVKYIYRPTIDLQKNEVVSSLPYDYKVYVRHNQNDYSAFVEWANQFDTIRLTNSCTEVLTNNQRWAIESYFYVRGEKTLTMSQLHLGEIIKKIEKIVYREAIV